jgi:GNAT superfamily N-acetyltransferase
LNENKPELSVVERLSKNHLLDSFDCGTHPSLNEWLRRFALTSQPSNSARTYLVHRNGHVVGYYSLCASSVAKEAASERVAKSQPARPIPVILLARLAVDKNEQGQGLGPAILKNALQRALSAAREIGARAVLVHAIDEEAKNFYKHFDFEDSPVNDLHLMMLMKDVEGALRG